MRRLPRQDIVTFRGPVEGRAERRERPDVFARFNAAYSAPRPAPTMTTRSVAIRFIRCATSTRERAREINHPLDRDPCTVRNRGIDGHFALMLRSDQRTFSSVIFFM